MFEILLYKHLFDYACWICFLHAFCVVLLIIAARTGIQIGIILSQELFGLTLISIITIKSNP